jgi:hypothetical protein
LAKIIPVSYFDYKYQLLPDKLLPPTLKGYFPEYKENQQLLMGELRKATPKIVIVKKSDLLEKEEEAFPVFFQFLNDFYLKEDENNFIFYSKLN